MGFILKLLKGVGINNIQHIPFVLGLYIHLWCNFLFVASVPHTLIPENPNPALLLVSEKCQVSHVGFKIQFDKYSHPIHCFMETLEIQPTVEGTINFVPNLRTEMIHIKLC